MGVGEGRIQRTNIGRTCPEHVTYSLSLSLFGRVPLCKYSHQELVFIIAILVQQVIQKQVNSRILSQPVCLPFNPWNKETFNIQPTPSNDLSWR